MTLRTADAEAVTLLHGAAALFPGETAMVDVPDRVPGRSAPCEGLGLSVPFVTARMYRGRPPEPGPFVTAVATPDLGRAAGHFWRVEMYSTSARILPRTKASRSASE
jgi:hypothetical protein